MHKIIIPEQIVENPHLNIYQPTKHLCFLVPAPL